MASNDPKAHVLEVGDDDDWGLQHPLACRPNLLACPVHREVKAVMQDDPLPPDRYVVNVVDGKLVALEILQEGDGG